MSIDTAKVRCDWPGCPAIEEVAWNAEGPVYDKHPDGKPNWLHLNSPTGTHVCHAHVGKSLKDINELKEKLKQAAPAADAILKGLGAHTKTPDVLYGAKAAFDHLYPGCDEVWKIAIKKAMQR